MVYPYKKLITLHPVYEEWYKRGFRDVHLDGRYKVNDKCEVIGVKGSKMTPNMHGQVIINRRASLNYHLALYAFFGVEKTAGMSDPTVDHIDGNHNNNDLNNLVWMERFENAAKAQKNRTRKPKVYNNELLKGEYFQTSPCLDRYLNQEDKEVKIMFSNKGRVRDSRGNISRGHRKDNTRYRRFYVGGKAYQMNQLIFRAFYNRYPVGDVCHDDSVPDSEILDEEGCYLNYPEHLSEGSRAENLRQHFMHKSSVTRVTHELDAEGNVIKTFHSIGEASRETGLSHQTILRSSNLGRSTSTGRFFRIDEPQNKRERTTDEEEDTNPPKRSRMQ